MIFPITDTIQKCPSSVACGTPGGWMSEPSGADHCASAWLVTSVCVTATQVTCLIVYLKAMWQMEEQPLELLTPSPSQAPEMFFTTDAVLNVQEAFRWWFPLLLSMLRQFMKTSCRSQVQHLFHRVVIFTLFLELKFVFSAQIHFYPNMSVRALILDLTSAVEDRIQPDREEGTESPTVAHQRDT